MREAQDSESPTHSWPPLCEHGGQVHSYIPLEMAAKDTAANIMSWPAEDGISLCPLPSHTAYDTSGGFSLR